MHQCPKGQNQDGPRGRADFCSVLPPEGFGWPPIRCELRNFQTQPKQRDVFEPGFG